MESGVHTPKFAVGSVVQHRHLGPGRIVGYDGEFYVIQFKGEIRRVPYTYQEMTAASQQVSGNYEELKSAVREVLGDYGWIDADLELNSRWAGGKIVMIPGKEGVQQKEIPLEAFFKKIIGVREKLRVLEQKLNNHTKLEAEEKLELQGYITRAYGSLTTFNVLFSQESSQFKGMGIKESE